MAESSKITAVLAGNNVVSESSKGFKVTTGVDGPKAGELFLMAVAGCSGSTMRAIMAKDGYQLTKLEITVEGLISEDRPRRYTDLNVHYNIGCPGLTEEKAAQYVKATGDTCFVMQSVAPAKHLTFTLLH